MTRIISLNIFHGGGTRINRLAEWIRSKSADAIVLTEWRDNVSGASIRDDLRQQGFVTSEGVRPGKTANGVLVASKSILDFQRLTPAEARSGEILRAVVPPAIQLLACYFPQKQDKAQFFLTCMAASSDTPLLFMGDFNTGNNKVDIEGSGARFYCADMFDDLTQTGGFIDLWRAQHPSCREWTWRSQINGFRIDHAFANKPFLDRFSPINCTYDHNPREHGLTDHSAVVLEFPATGTRGGTA